MRLHTILCTNLKLKSSRLDDQQSLSVYGLCKGSEVAHTELNSSLDPSECFVFRSATSNLNGASAFGGLRILGALPCA